MGGTVDKNIQQSIAVVFEKLGIKGDSSAQAFAKDVMPQMVADGANDILTAKDTQAAEKWATKFRDDHPTATIHQALNALYREATHSNKRVSLPDDPRGQPFALTEPRDSAGELHGLYEERDGNGEILQRGQYEHGVKEGKWTEVGVNGQMVAQGNYRGGVQMGSWKRTGADGSWSVQTYDQEGGYRDVQYAPNGKKTSESYLAPSDLTRFGMGYSKYLSATTNVYPSAGRVEFPDGAESSRTTNFYDNGNKRSEGHSTDGGDAIGFWRYYDEQGMLAGTIEWGYLTKGDDWTGIVKHELIDHRTNAELNAEIARQKAGRAKHPKD